jgi:hypothetical protein
MRLLSSALVAQGMRVARRSLYDIPRRFCWNEAEGVTERLVLVCDPKFNFSDLARGHESTVAARIKRPASGHVVSEYTSYVHKHGAYNFNTVDDYSLNVAAAHPLPPGGERRPETELETHSLTIWPDNIVVSGATRSTVSVLGKCLLTQNTLTSDVLAGDISGGAVVSQLSGIHIIMPVSGTYTVSNVLRALEWFKSSLSGCKVEQDVTYYIGSEVRRPHSVPTQAIVLPYGLQYTDVHSQKRVDQIVQEILHHTKGR